MLLFILILLFKNFNFSFAPGVDYNHRVWHLKMHLPLPFSTNIHPSILIQFSLVLFLCWSWCVETFLYLYHHLSAVDVLNLSTKLYIFVYDSNYLKVSWYRLSIILILSPPITAIVSVLNYWTVFLNKSNNKMKQFWCGLKELRIEKKNWEKYSVNSNWVSIFVYSLNFQNEEYIATACFTKMQHI